MDDAHCENHESFNEDCTPCQKIKTNVTKYQRHRHKSSCHKKKKNVIILADEGHGRFDGLKKANPLIFPSCRYNFPHNPIDNTEFILGFPKDTHAKILKKAKEDYNKIRKYLQRLTHPEDYINTIRYKEFEKMSFFDYLFEVGMFEEDNSKDDPEAQQKARDRYLSALRCELSINIVHKYI